MKPFDQQLRDDINAAADWVELQAENMYATDYHMMNAVAADMLPQASKMFKITEGRIREELISRQAQRLIDTLPRGIKNRIK